MRDDMARVIVERPRIPDHGARRGRALPFGQLPAQEAMRRPHLRSWGGKQLNENLAPLRRYLERQIGRPWDKVYSDIAAHLRVDNAVRQHVRDHLRDFVAIKPRRVRGWRHERSGLWWQPFYVDPATGLLKRTDRLMGVKAARRARQQARPTPPERIVLAADRELRRLDGIWYAVQLAPLPEPVYRAFPETRLRKLKPWAPNSPVVSLAITVRRLVSPAVKDVVTRALIPAGPETDDEASWRAYRQQYPDRRYVIGKHMLAKAELRRHRLQNLPPREDWAGHG
jgi:hypothetical protein